MLHSFLDGKISADELKHWAEFVRFRGEYACKNSEIDEIADALKLSEKTIANYQSLLKKKLNVSNSIEIVKLAMQNGLIDTNQ